ncbi:MAG: sigma 54-interacting transcriptional regulator [Alphaproteobacteria bacterium]|nr:sigma 54-interacting transcriptional regulator [Alphaproteobacteria bacterium]
MSENDLLPALSALQATLGAPSAEVRAHLGRLRRLVRQADRHRRDAERLRTLLARTLDVASARGAEPVAEHVLDGMIAVLGARRGLIGVVQPGGWSVLVGRDLDEQDLDDPEAQVSTGMIEHCLKTGEAVVDADAVAGDFADRLSVNALGLKSVLVLPFAHRTGARGFVYLDNARVRGLFDPDSVTAVRQWMPLVEECLGRALAERKDADQPFPDVVARSPSFLRKLTELARVARFDAPILLMGETGTGKSMLARRVHAASARSGQAFVHVNCGALPEALIEAELFGAEEGAFTGARSRAGRFEAARGGTLFLDELNSMPEACQVKLLVALQEKQITRLGSSRPIPVDARVIGAMNDLGATGGLREDLYYRLAVFPIRVPPLRERREDIPLLARMVLERTRSRWGLPELRLSTRALAQLDAHPWPGNVRELENVLDRAALLATDGVIESLELRPPPPRPGVSAGPVYTPAPSLPPGARGKVTEAEFLAAWEAEGGHNARVADRLGIRVRSVYRLRKRYLEGEED